MKDYIPLFQSLIWPIFLAILIIAFRSWFQDLLDIIKKRIESGSPVNIGPSGFELGAAPKLEPAGEESGPPPEEIIEIAQEQKTAVEERFDLSKYFRLVHAANYSPEYSQKAGRAYYELQVYLDADNETFLDKVSKVVYHLHPTFPNPDREIQTRENNFRLTTYAWGQFDLSADVYFRHSEEKPLRLSRYLNF